MRKIILTALAAALMAASTAPMAVAAERQHVRKADRAVSDQFRNANNALASQPGPCARYAFHGFSAPAGR